MSSLLMSNLLRRAQRSAPGRKVVAFAVPGLLLGATLLSGCQEQPGPSVADDGLATLTAAAASNISSGDMIAGDQPVTTESDGATPEPQIDTEIELDPDSPASIARETQRAVDATQGIANPQTAIAKEPALATFTPAPGTEPDGEMLYLRAGNFYRASANGDDIEKVGNDDMPVVWGPPEDPGRAWADPSGERVAFFGGRDAELYVMDGDGDNMRRLSTANLPTGEHLVSVSGMGEIPLRLLPGRDYTLVLTPGETPPGRLLVDDNNYHIRGEARVRVIHASEALRDRELVIAFNGGTPVRGEVGFGESTGDYSLPSGSLSIEADDAQGERIALLRDLTLGDKTLNSIFLYGAGDLRVVEAEYAVGEPAAGESRLRVFNSSGTAVNVEVDGAPVASGLAGGTLSPYRGVPALVGQDQLQELGYSIYGHRAGEQPLAWSSDGERIAFLGGGDGNVDLYIAETGGNVRRLTQSAEREINPRWSPNGERLAWVAYDETSDTFSAHVFDGERAREIDLVPVLTSIGQPPNTPVDLPEPLGWVDDEHVFLYPNVSTSLGVWMYDLDSDEFVQLTDAELHSPQWSPEAQMWVFGVQGDAGQIYTLAPDGEQEMIVESEGFAPEWSPNGEVISWVQGHSMSTDGWSLHLIHRDGSGDRDVTGQVALLQDSPPVPGPNAKRWWFDEGESLVFSRVGRDYGAAERDAGFGGTAGNDIENLWIVSVDGNDPPRRLTDFMKVFYLKEVKATDNGNAIGVVGLSYLDRAQQLWAVRTEGGSPAHVDAGVRWYMWLE